MLRTLLAADLHLEPGERPEQNDRLAAFLAAEASKADRLVLLGDAFHCWFERDGRAVGDYAEVLDLFARAARAGLDIRHVSGNRDFAVGGAAEPEGYAGFFSGLLPRRESVLARAGIRPEGPRFVWNQDGRRIHALHGDSLSPRRLLLFRALRWLLLGPVGRTLMARGPWSWGERAVARLQVRPRNPRRYRPRADHVASAAAVREVEAGADLVVCGHTHVADRRPLAAAGGRTGELIILPAWRDSGACGALENGQFLPLGP